MVTMAAMAIAVAVAVVATMAVMDRLAVAMAVSPIVTAPVGGRHRRQQGEREHRKERRQPG